MGQARNPMEAFANAVITVIESPITWFRETIVEPNQKKYPWYHEQFRRVPTIDQCYTDDNVCRYEAQQQFRRDRMVDNEILNILRIRFEDCMLYEAPDHMSKCRSFMDALKNAEDAWFSKYGDLGAYGDVKDAYMKQKHRMIWEKRHGKIGSGMKATED